MLRTPHVRGSPFLFSSYAAPPSVTISELNSIGILLSVCFSTWLLSTNQAVQRINKNKEPSPRLQNAANQEYENIYANERS